MRSRRRRVAPVEIFDRDDDGRVLSECAHPGRQGVEEAAAPELGALVDTARRRVLDAEQPAEARRGIRRVGAQHRQRVGKDRAARRIVVHVVELQRAAEKLRHWREWRRRGECRALTLEPDGLATAPFDDLEERLQEAGLAETRLRDEECHSWTTGIRLVDRADQRGELVRSADHGEVDARHASRRALADRGDLPHPDRPGDALHLGRTPVHDLEPRIEKAADVVADRDRARRRDRLDARSDVRRAPEGGGVGTRRVAHLANDSGTRVDADARFELDAVSGSMGVHVGETIEDREPREHGTLRVVLVREGISEVREQSVAEVLRDVPVEAVDDCPAHLLVGEHELAELLRIELLRQRRRSDEVAEQDRQTPPLPARDVGRRAGNLDLRYAAPRAEARETATASPQPGHRTSPGIDPAGSRIPSPMPSPSAAGDAPAA